MMDTNSLSWAWGFPVLLKEQTNAGPRRIIHHCPAGNLLGGSV